MAVVPKPWPVRVCATVPVGPSNRVMGPATEAAARRPSGAQATAITWSWMSACQRAHAAPRGPVSPNIARPPPHSGRTQEYVYPTLSHAEGEWEGGLPDPGRILSARRERHGYRLDGDLFGDRCRLIDLEGT